MNRSHAFLFLTVVLGSSAVACTAEPQAGKQQYVERAERYRAAGRLAEAIIEYRNAVEQDPLAGDVRIKLAEAYLQVGDTRNGTEEYVRAADFRPGDVGTATKAGSLLLLAGQFDDARAWADKVL